jgi:hypothetical protein
MERNKKWRRLDTPPFLDARKALIKSASGEINSSLIGTLINLPIPHLN